MSLPLIYANTIIKHAIDRNTQLSHMKLQKLLYFLYARYAAHHDSALFSNQFEPWPYGPVLSDVYEAFKEFGSRSIDKFHKECDGSISIVDESSIPFYECLNEVWLKYGAYNGIELSKLTHEQGTAWHEAWQKKNQFLKWEDIIADGERFFTTNPNCAC